MRCLDHASVSNHGLLVRVVRWAFCPIGVDGVRGGASTAGALLRSFLNKLEFDDWEFVVYWDPTARNHRR